MNREELLHFLAGEIAGRKKQNKPLKVAIDGRCAAGKSTFADALRAALLHLGFEVLSPSVDGFHHPAEFRCRKGEYSAP